MPLVRTFLAGCTACVCVALLQSTPVAAYQQADLTGTWEALSIASGPGAPWWDRSHALIARDGSFTAFSVSSAGELDTLHASLALAPTGVLTFVGSSTFRGALDIGSTVFVATDTWSTGGAGTTELRVGAKSGGVYALSDLAGAWENFVIASGPGAPWWERGRLQIAGDGTFAGSMTDDEGQPDPVSGVFGLTPSGILSFAGSSTARGALDAGRTVVVMNSTWQSGAPGTADFSVAVKMAPSYALSDLAGTWELHALATGPGAPWWERQTITIATNGTFTGTASRSDGSSGPVSGALSLSPTGVLTRPGWPAARGALDAGRSVMVWTDTWSTGSPGTTQLLVGVRTGGSTAGVDGLAPLTFTLDPVRPNPAHGRDPQVSFELPTRAPAQLEVVDVGGRRVVMREVGALGAGRHTVGLSEGARLAPGLYLVRLRQGSHVRTQRVVVL